MRPVALTEYLWTGIAIGTAIGAIIVMVSEITHETHPVVIIPAPACLMESEVLNA